MNPTGYTNGNGFNVEGNVYLNGVTMTNTDGTNTIWVYTNVTGYVYVRLKPSGVISSSGGLQGTLVP